MLFSPRLLIRIGRCKSINYNGLFLCGKKCGKKPMDSFKEYYSTLSPSNGLFSLHFGILNTSNVFTSPSVNNSLLIAP